MLRHSLAAGLATLALHGAVTAAPFVPVTDAMLQRPAAQDWPMFRRTLDSWGYSPLRQIDAGNVSKLELVWSHALAPGLQETTPLVYDGTMYLPNPGDVTQAVDGRTGKLIWEYRRQWPDDLSSYIGYPYINRNLAIHGQLLFDNSADDFVYAIDATTGKLAWETKILDYRTHGAQQSSGPIVVNGKVVSGRGCQPEGGPPACVIVAHDAQTGRELWRTRTIAAADTPDGASWGALRDEQRWHVGSWMVPSFDPKLNRIFIGTSVTAPSPKFMLAGNDLEYLYHNSTLALDPDTGRIVWHYQHLVDHWDLDHPFERLLVDTVVAPDPAEVNWINPRLKKGERRKVITGIPGKTGVVYTIDRTTGEFLWARPTILQNVVASIDGATGKATVNPAALFHKAGDERFICPHTFGGKNFPVGAYSPITNAMYYPLQNTCMLTSVASDKPDPTKLYMISTAPQIAPGTDKIGSLYAVSAQTGRLLWKYEQRAAMTSVFTSGSLVFAGDSIGQFRAFDQRTGRILWETSLGSAVTGYPITYAVGGRQFVAVSTGVSLVTSGMNGLAPELQTGAENKLFVFALPE